MRIEVRDPNGGNQRITEDFLRADSGKENNRILIFARSGLLNLLSNSSIWHMDGTFDVVPQLWSQLLTINVEWNESANPAQNNRHTLPCAFALLPNKEEVTYKRCFHMLDNLIDQGPNKVHCDFEIGMHNGIRGTWKSDLEFCYFHLSQSFQNRIKKLNLADAISKEESLSIQFKMIKALAFIPVDDVIIGFQLLYDYVDDRLHEFLAYLETNYIGARSGSRRVNPRYPMSGR
uniref:MULE transposase domain-containing protein n=1 Tax=Acrobeloides nanus TaxID=290746 RepID=A0A914DBG8_9BILA